MYGRRLRSLFGSTKGNVAMIAALAAVPLLLAATGVIELTDISNAKAKLQAAVDAGALMGAGQLGITSTTSGDSGILNAATTTASQTIAGGISSGGQPAAFAASIDAQRNAVTVTGQMDHKPLIGFMDFGGSHISVTATAETMQQTPLCVLQTGSSLGINVQDSATIRATGCAVHANQNIKVASGGMIQAQAVQAVGTVSGPTQPGGNSGALPISDPFASMDLSPHSLCSLSGPLLPISLGSGTMSLPPGLHCLPITVLGNGTLYLEPGEHYFLAPLIMTGNSTLQGDDVALIFGVGNVFNFAQSATVQLSARRSGPYAGFLIATSRDNLGTFTIASSNVRQLLGTIYIPNANLVVDTKGNVAQDSAWSVIVAKTLTLKQNPVLVINSNYVGAGIPVPAGVGPRNEPVLSQ